MLTSKLAFSLLLSALTATSAWAVINGYRPDPRKLPIAERMALVVLPGSRCTGTLITDRVVLTAAHCDNANYPMADGLKPHLAQGLAYLKKSSYIRKEGQAGTSAIDGIVLKRYWGRGGTHESREGGALGDMMLLLLDEPVKLSGDVRVKLPVGAMGAVPSLLALGYGVSEVQDGKLRAYTLREEMSLGEGVRGSELDTFDIVSPRGGALCEGDSGGPVFEASADGAWQLAGVYSSQEYKKKWGDSFRGAPAKGSVKQCQRAMWFTFTSARVYSRWIEGGVRELYRRNGLPATEAVIR